MPTNIYYIGTESAIRALGDLAKGDDAVHLGFDLDIYTDTTVIEQRSVRIGIHLLRLSDRIFGVISKNYFNPTFERDLPWEFISQHDSCWPDSTMHWIGNIIQSVMEQKDNHPVVAERYKDDKLKYNNDKASWSMELRSTNIVKKDEYEGIVYVDRHDREDRTYKLTFKNGLIYPLIVR
jgi:hypothetical protein